MASALTSAQRDHFESQGYLLVRSALGGEELAALGAELAGWVEESRRHKANWGESLDGRSRFDLEAGHDADRPRLRRVNNPAEVSEAYRAVVFDSAVPDLVAALVGPDVKFHHCKINLKPPRSETRVGYHQDFPYTPHSNEDIVETLILLDDMSTENGCLHVVPGSHREGLLSLWQGDTFSGEIAAETVAALRPRTVPVEGRAGDVCFMNAMVVHGSEANRSESPRGLFICCYTAADAIPLSPSPLPNRFEGATVRGKPSRFARMSAMVAELPESHGHTSFFAVQGQPPADGD
jgi:ectoine hydroxylase-related dioxygenase (phytanoyl-CoA dioxygenase family)